MDNKDEFVGIIQENEGLIVKVASVYTNSKEDSQDLRQEIIYQLWKSFPSFRKEAKLTTWMYRIALNTGITHINRQKRKGNHEPINEALLHKTESHDTLKEEQLEILYTHIRKLSPVEKGIILLYLEGKSYEEMAAITGFTTTNIGTRLGRIKQKIIAQIN